MWSEASETWMREFANNNSIFIAYLYFPPSQSYQPPHNIKRETVICDLYLKQAEGGVDWGELSISRPPISDHLAFNLVTKGFASSCPYFESALNRKKSQRLLKEYMQAQKAGQYLKQFSNSNSQICRKRSFRKGVYTFSIRTIF